MRTRTRLAVGAAGAVVAAGFLAGCGGAGSSGTQAPATGAQGAGCAPVAGSSLVVLDDDKKLQNTDNIIPAINSKVAQPQLVAALDKVSDSLDTSKLIGLNKAVDVDRKTPKVAAEEFASANNLTAGIPTGGTGSITVGAANFSENQTLGELYRIALTAAGYQVKVQQIGNRELYEPALEKGDIQVVPEYAATMADFLNNKVNAKGGATPPPISSPDLNQTVSGLKAAGEKVGITFGKPSAAQDQNAFAVTKEFADKYGVRTLSELAAKCSGSATVLGGPPECPQRPKCQAGLVQVYNFNAGRFDSLDAGGPQTKSALTSGTISVGLVFSSDGALATS
ncbi:MULTISPECIES: glycine betaine ABC transporter substrate-binding protein [unclassified Plantactinospora]|uniref:glycine betaine ABC transporter substrate-binding protein n=1 Tax=unclassified Plantactinospora TaxID=2631981 RepID=UPI000D15D47A|nr:MULTISPECIES: glycine betaine ABC transporter substrate-binding protein [unclassified Plantactinospora]AVT29803.1 glycine/betaine ABC transporter substrate-binding protein [Plantactinospora sp. BC1]AVT36309.1 glycine/betaine ABC transporter substrate-binding protein [Plantactinospora sp. BB1]